MTVLHIEYRPRKFGEVVGQEAVCRALAGLIERGESRAFLLSGPSGTGKTTLARIAARALGCADKDVLEIDAATHTGIDSMRQVQELIQYRPFGRSKWRVIIVDETHMLSKAAWNSMLKVIEAPPEFVAWFLCTTEPGKVPQTIKTRCSALTLRLVAETEMRKLYARVAEAEAIKLLPEVRDAVIREAEGSPRQMLVNMALCREAKSRKEASALLRDARESDGVAELCKFLMRGGSWSRAAALLEALADEPPESVRIGVCNYLGGALRRAASDKQACTILALLEPFVEPFAAGADRAMLAVAVGRALYGGE
ncbi:MAG: AAA family ATPase [Deltaproteobacteria bacterium]|nr:AAA family ATPase [Deltaproteobacteria bacterium]